MENVKKKKRENNGNVERVGRRRSWGVYWVVRTERIHLFIEVIAESLPSTRKELSIQVKEAGRTPNNYKKRSSCWPIRVKIPEVNHEQNSKPVRAKLHPWGSQCNFHCRPWRPAQLGMKGFKLKAKQLSTQTNLSCKTIFQN